MTTKVVRHFYSILISFDANELTLSPWRVSFPRLPRSTSLFSRSQMMLRSSTTALVSSPYSRKREAIASMVLQWTYWTSPCRQRGRCLAPYLSPLQDVHPCEREEPAPLSPVEYLAHDSSFCEP